MQKSIRRGFNSADAPPCVGKMVHMLTFNIINKETDPDYNFGLHLPWNALPEPSSGFEFRYHVTFKERTAIGNTILRDPVLDDARRKTSTAVKRKATDAAAATSHKKATPKATRASRGRSAASDSDDEDVGRNDGDDSESRYDDDGENDNDEDEHRRQERIDEAIQESLRAQMDTPVPKQGARELKKILFYNTTLIMSSLRDKLSERRPTSKKPEGSARGTRGSGGKKG